MFSKSILTLTLMGFSTMAFAADEVEKSESEQETIVVKEESAPVPAPKPIKKKSLFEDEEEDFSIDFSKSAEAKSDFVDEVPLDFEITDDPNNHKTTVKRPVEDPIEVETATEEQVKEAKDVDWSFDVDADEEE